MKPAVPRSPSTLLLCAALTLGLLPAAHAGPPPGGALTSSIPEGAVAALVVQRGALDQPRLWLEQLPELRADLATYLRRISGADMTRIEGAAAFSTSVGKSQAVVLRLPTGEAPKGKRLRRVGGADLISMSGGLVAARAGAALVLGDETDVTAAVLVLQGKGRALQPGSPLGVLLSPEAVDAEVAVAVDLRGLPDRKIQSFVKEMGVTSAVLTYQRGTLTASVLGDQAGLARARDLLQQALDAGLEKARRGRDKAMTSDDSAGALGEIIGYHYALSLAREGAPRLEGGRLVSRVKLPKLGDGFGAVVPLAGVVAAVAIPSFVRYTKRSKTAEVTFNLRKLADSAVSYYFTERVDQSGAVLTPEFPLSVNWTPARPCCEWAGEKCAPDPQAWAGQPWEALSFSMDDPHRYQYRLIRKGKGKDQTLLIEARGDLDCNGTYGTFSRLITLDQDARPRIGPLQSRDELE